MTCPDCGGTRFWNHDRRRSSDGTVRVRVRCANQECGRRLTVSGAIRDRSAEEERRRTFFRLLAAQTPLVGIVRARDRARAVCDVSPATASRLISRGSIPRHFRQHRTSLDHYALVETVMLVYARSHRKQSDFPIHDPKRPDPDLEGIDPDLLWLLLSRARGIAALVVGLPRPVFGDPAPAAFPSWIDRGGRGVDPLRKFYPPSRHACAAEILGRLWLTLRAEMPEGNWDSEAARDWMRTAEVRPQLEYYPPPRSRGIGPLWIEDDEWTGPEVDGLGGDPPPVPDPGSALRIIRREVLHAKRLAACSSEGRVDEGLRYWVDTRPVGMDLRVLVTLGGRIVGRAATRLKEPAIIENSAELRLAAEDASAKVATLEVGRETIMLPWREDSGADDGLAKRLLLPPSVRPRKSPG